jgi:hypothetical protein
MRRRSRSRQAIRSRPPNRIWPRNPAAAHFEQAEDTNSCCGVVPTDYGKWLAVLIQVEFLAVAPPGSSGHRPLCRSFVRRQRTFIVAEDLQITADAVDKFDSHGERSPRWQPRTLIRAWYTAPKI